MIAYAIVANVRRAQVAVVAVAVSEAFHTGVSALIAEFTWASIATAATRSHVAHVRRRAEQPVITGGRIVGVLARAEFVALVRRAYVAVNAIGSGKALDARIEQFTA